MRKEEIFKGNIRFSEISDSIIRLKKMRLIAINGDKGGLQSPLRWGV